jgi:hypothetical protein
VQLKNLVNQFGALFLVQSQNLTEISKDKVAKYTPYK